MNFTTEKNSDLLLSHKPILGTFIDLEELNTLISLYYSASHFKRLCKQYLNSDMNSPAMNEKKWSWGQVWVHL
jgi:hypothetical protein